MFIWWWVAVDILVTVLLVNSFYTLGRLRFQRKQLGRLKEFLYELRERTRRGAKVDSSELEDGLMDILLDDPIGTVEGHRIMGELKAKD